MPDRRSTVPLIALAVFALIAVGLQASFSWGLFDAQYHLAERARVPFAVTTPDGTIANLEDEAKAAGLTRGLKLLSLDGHPARGEGSPFESVRDRKPGDALTVG